MITNLEEFDSLLKLCRKQGVEKITWGDLQIEFGAPPIKRQKNDDIKELGSSEPTAEELLFWSVNEAG